MNSRWEKSRRHDDIVLKLISKQPIQSRYIRPSGMEPREIDRALQRLRRAGKIKVVRGDDCGPGGSWVRA